MGAPLAAKLRAQIGHSLFTRRARGAGKQAVGGTSEAARLYASTPLPEPTAPLATAPLLALDFELDGLRSKAHLLQAGWVAFDLTSIPMASARAHDIRSYARLDGEAVAIHGIGEQRAAGGQAVAKVLEALVTDLAGRVLVAHGAQIEREAFERTWQKLHGYRLPVRTICTMQLERRLNPDLKARDAYRLNAARARYGLPPYRGHDALSDALAAAELLQAQCSRLPAGAALWQVEHFG